jgi:glutamyl-tRNA(Gln) amidotransferase subunit E
MASIMQIMDLDYKKIGFKAGIEIHQELDTKKLFCNCSTSFKEEEKISQIKRKMRAVAGETGEIDMASAYEQFRDREFIYNGYRKEFCLIDLDEEPPMPVNEDAFCIALGVAKLFHLKVPETLCVMRKTVTDGSAVSGFQRTILVGLGSAKSYIETEKGKVKIDQLNLEEDACKIEEKMDNKVIYSLSRLGIPLLEIGTDASLQDPEHVTETAHLIGTYLRSFKVKRGIGTIRQDVNVSIRGGARIEVKGWQDLHKLSELVKNEAMRQYVLLEIKKELETRGLKRFEKKALDATAIFRDSPSKIISELIQKGGKVHALLLPRFSGLLKKQVCEGKTFGKELSEYAKAYGTKGMIHTDEDLSKYRLEKEFEALKKKLGAKEDDLVIIVAEREDIASKAIDSVYQRALYCLVGVPEETRIPNHLDATSSFARPLPGAHRLYPETDIPNIEVDEKTLSKIRLPELLPDKIKRYEKEFGIPDSISKDLLKKDLEFEDLVRKFKRIEPRFIAHSLVEMPKEIKKRYQKDIDDGSILAVLSNMDNGIIGKDAVLEILSDIVQGKAIDYAKYKKMSDQELLHQIGLIKNQNPGLPENALIGKVMEKLRGKAEGKTIVELIKRLSK